jgi:hypothetical protein
LGTVAGSVAVQTDADTLDGTGVTADKIRLKKVYLGEKLSGLGTSASPVAFTGISTNSSLTGNGTTASPLGTVAGSVAVQTDADTLDGTGVTADKIRLKKVYLGEKLSGLGTSASPVAFTGISTNSSLTGNGTTASPLGTVAGSVAVQTDADTLDGTGITADKIRLKKVYVDSSMSGLGTSATPVKTNFSSEFACWRQSQTLVTGSGGITILQDNQLGSYPSVIPSNLVAGLYTVAKAGIYDVKATALFTANATGARTLFINYAIASPSVNGSVTAIENTNTAGNQTALSVSDTYKFAVGDTVRIQASQTSGGNLAVTVSISINYLGP